MGVGDFGGRGVGEFRPGGDGAGERERDAVEHVQAALAGDDGVLFGEGTVFSGQGEQVGGGAFADPMPAGQAHGGGQSFRCVEVAAGEPVVEQAGADADAAGDGGGVPAGGGGWYRVE
nr:hypothetical protein [Nocardia pneumoniae]